MYTGYAGEFVSMDTDEFVVKLRDGESKLYRLLTPNTYAVTVTRNSGGTVSDFGLTEVEPGSSMAIKVKANDGYHVKTITINGEDVDVSKGKIQLSDINENMVVKVKFAKGDVAKTAGTIGFAWWPIMLITIGSIIFIGGTIFLVVWQKRKNKRVKM